MMCQKLFALALFSMMQAVLMMQAERKGLDKAWEDVKTVLKGKGNIGQELGELVPLVAVRMHEERKVSSTICKNFPDAEICNNAEDRSLWHKIKHGVEKGAKEVVHGVEKVGEDIGKGAKKVGHDIGEVAEKGWNKTKHWTENEWNKLKPEVEKELDKVLDSVKDKVKDEAGKALKDVKNIFKGKGNIGKETAEAAEEIAEEAVEIVPEIL